MSNKYKIKDAGYAAYQEGRLRTEAHKLVIAVGVVDQAVTFQQTNYSEMALQSMYAMHLAYKVISKLTGCTIEEATAAINRLSIEGDTTYEDLFDWYEAAANKLIRFCESKFGREAKEPEAMIAFNAASALHRFTFTLEKLDDNKAMQMVNDAITSHSTDIVAYMLKHTDPEMRKAMISGLLDQKSKFN